MRCLALANALKIFGIESHFICRKVSGGMLQQIQDQGHIVHSFFINESLKDNAWELDAKICREILHEIHPDWVVVDHYELDIRWEKIIKTCCAKLMVIDDLANRLHDCDILLDQTLGRSPEMYAELTPEHCILLLGTKYALLRSDFAQLREYSLKRREAGKLEHLLISMGGSDPHNITQKVLSVLDNSCLPRQCKITIILGAQFSAVEQIKKQAANMLWETNILCNVSNMAEIMANADLAIGAAGSTSWERCCLGLPGLVIILADNQREVARNLVLKNAIHVLELNQFFSKDLHQKMIAMTERIQLVNMSRAAASIVDGLGAKAVMKVMGIKHV
ncbi:UDP-2,4-diacetamido-2,4,6-trideoxy-beta-L-altropyranose hydrolase [Legionella israelensis]|uniref:UDP-2,4-diacetamido-2,4, 6-trideoxy-beta-L-altropyranose hydrolase n=1 Tax=Legionella israelensis TaxID=454 RepID=UPI001FD3E9DF|nr:UDP-2,4-diacetamido-2,4,6-trideoxy-beta-L-altropyranose hydrolase [Legionella israelensis]